MKIRFLQPAEAEYLQALEHYAGESQDLAEAFLRDLKHSLTLLKEHPLIGHPYEAECRRLLFRSFPHGLVYQAFGEELVIVAVVHQRQGPKPWHERLDV